MNISKTLLVTLLSLTGFFFCTQTTKAQFDERNIGVGLIVGEPTGISAKWWQNETVAYDAGVTWALSYDAELHLHADYLRHNYDLLGKEISKGKLPLYYGVGARLRLSDDPVLGARVPVGVNYLFKNEPIGIFIEAVPTLNLLPDVDFELNGGIGARYYF